MSPFSIILLVLIALYIAVLALDKFLVQPKRDGKTLPDLVKRIEKLEDLNAKKPADDLDDVD